MRFEHAARIADTVLFEGYVLYPYRAGSTKNVQRWTFGVLAPERWSEATGAERWWLETQLLVCGVRPNLRGRLRFLSIVDRRVEIATERGFAPIDRLEVDGRIFIPWEEGVTREIDFALVDGRDTTFGIDADASSEPVYDAHGALRGRVLRSAEALSGTVRVRVESLEKPPGEDPLWRVSIRVLNRTPWTDNAASRAEIMPASFASTHLLVGAESGRFISLLDPPPHAEAAAAACKSIACWPVLAGPGDSDDVVLCAPIVLYDRPQIAPESTGDFFDATEIDELLALRTRTLTPEEKALARATDPRAAAVVDRAETMTEAELADTSR